MPADPALARIARDDGTFLMVAMDQRESLRAMLAEASGRASAQVADAELIAFKQTVAEVLAPEASGLLIDPEFGGSVLERGDGGAVCGRSGAGLIVAADVLSSRPGEIVGDADFDVSLDLAGHAARGVAAAKLLVLWRDDGRADERVAAAERFVTACRAAGLPSIVEGVVRPATAEPAKALECARALGAVGPSLYKVEVPYHGRAEATLITAAAEALTEALPCPWVVLSSHVDRADFPDAVAAACRGGASGVLAGRALWAHVLGAADHRTALRELSLPYLRELSKIVAAHGRPWGEAG